MPQVAARRRKHISAAGLACLAHLLHGAAAAPLSGPAAGVTWRDWDRRQVCHPGQLLQPASVEEVQATARQALVGGQQLKVVGAGHSFSPITLTDERQAGRALLLNLDKLNRVLELPAAAPSADGSSVLVQAGIRVHELNTQLLAAGWALENTGAIAEQSVAGATQTGTHGTGSALGSMSSQLLGLRLILANGTSLWCDAATHADVWAAARVGLGALGVVVEARVRVVPKFKLMRVAMPFPGGLEALLLALPRLKLQYARLQYYWTPLSALDAGALNATLLLRWPVPVDTPIPAGGGCWPGDVERSIASGQNVSCVDWSFRALAHESAFDGTRALYTEMEYFVDVRHEAQLLSEFRAYQQSAPTAAQSRCKSAGRGAAAGLACGLFTGVRYGKSDSVSWMAPMYERDIAVVSMIVSGDSQRKASGPVEEVELFDRALERIAWKYGGRPHWGKMNWAGASEIRAVYPRLDDFVALRARLDPAGMFLNDYLRRVLGL